MNRTLDKYELLEEIGHGGMATVFRARDTRLDRFVAVKVIHPHLKAAKEVRVRMAQEARAIARLKHPFIPEVYDYSGESSEECYLVTELLTGPTLRDFAEQHPLIPAEIAASIVLQVLAALEAAHERGIVHRDVKPENILLHDHRCVKLTDFGIAHIVDAHSLTATGQVLGSPFHMAPEQIEAGICDPRTDLFAVGTVLYYLAVGQLPFEGKNPHQILKRIMDGDYADPLRVRPSVGESMKEILTRSLSSRPEDRYPDAAAFRVALQGFLNMSGIDDAELQLEQFFKNPEAVSQELHARVIRKLVENGQACTKAREHIHAAHHFNRVLAMDPGNANALAALAALDRSIVRRRGLVVAFMALSIVIAGVSFAFWGGQMERSGRSFVRTAPRQRSSLRVPRQEILEPMPPAVTAVLTPEAHLGFETQPQTPRRASRSRETRLVVFRPTPQNVSISIDGSDFRPYGPSFQGKELSLGSHHVRIVGAAGCCKEENITINLPDGTKPFVLETVLKYHPAGVYVVSNVHGDVKIGSDVVVRTRELVEFPMQTHVKDLVPISVTAAGYEGYAGRVNLRAGEVTEVQATLHPVE